MRMFLLIGFVVAAVWPLTAEDAAELSPGELIQALRSPKESARLQAIDRLGRQGEKAQAAVPALAKLLKDESALVRAHAADALGHIGAPAKPAVAALAELITDPDSRVRRAAIDAVRAIRPGPEVAVPLAVKVLEDADDAARLRALDALAEGGAKAVPGLVEALKNEKAAYWACLVLSDIGPDAKAAVPALIETLKDERPGVRREAILALAAVGKAASPAVPSLAKALDDEINRVVAIYALGSIGSVPGSVENKIESFVKSEDGVLSTVSLWALARLHPDNQSLVRKVVERLAEGLKAEDPRHRTAAARALIDLDPDPEIARPIIIRAMEGASPEVLDAAMDAIASLGERAVPRVIQALGHEELRARAASVLARIGPKAAPAVPALITALADENPDTRSEVLFALAAIGPDAKEAVPAILKVMGDPETKVCYAACYALGKIGPAAIAAEPRLQKCLRGSDEFLCMASAWALAQIHPKCPTCAALAVPVLIKALGDPDPLTRVHAAEALGRFGPLAKDATAALKKSLQDENPDIRKAAADALRAIGG